MLKTCNPISCHRSWVKTVIDDRLCSGSGNVYQLSKDIPLTVAGPHRIYTDFSIKPFQVPIYYLVTLLL